MIIKNVFDEIFSMENLYEAMDDASKTRRYHQDVMLFRADAWNELHRLRSEIVSGRYCIDRYYIFYVYEPKKRMIMSISFRHRVTQWAIYRIINPMLVKGYIKDSYGCIPGRGALHGVQRLQYWIKDIQRKQGDWYYLKLDISKYFYRVSHRILKKLLRKKIKDERLMQLLERIIDCKHTPFGLPPGKSPGDVPLEERLYDVGMPIGNLLSQMFANLYLDALDQFCKRVLGIHYYVRYMDDIIILANDKALLRRWEGRIAVFLKSELELDLNKKTCIRPISQGVEFIGYKIRANSFIFLDPHISVRKSTSLHMTRTARRLVKDYRIGTKTAHEVYETLSSHMGMLKYCDCESFKHKLLDNYTLSRPASVSEV